MGEFWRYGLQKSAATQYGDRVDRAFRQSLQLQQCHYYSRSHRWELRVLSSKGDDYYRVRFTPTGGSCTCHDFVRRRKPCKHMLCVLLRMLRLRDNTFTTVKQVGESYDRITDSLLALFHRQLPESAVDVAVGSVTQMESSKKRKRQKRRMDAVISIELDKEDNIVESNETTGSEPGPSQILGQCCICLLECGSVADPSLVRCTAACQRIMGHHDCLNNWFARSNKCPLYSGIQQGQSGSRKKRARGNVVEVIDLDALHAAHPQAVVDDDVFFEIFDA
jgi:hypothetical protein